MNSVVFVSTWRLIQVIILLRAGNVLVNDPTCKTPGCPLLFAQASSTLYRSKVLTTLVGNTATHQLLFISETPFAIMSACIPCSLHLMNEIARKIRRLSTKVIPFQGLATSATSADPKAHSPGRPRRSNLCNSDGFVQLHDISTASPTSRLEILRQADSILPEAATEEKGILSQQPPVGSVSGADPLMLKKCIKVPIDRRALSYSERR